MKIAILLLPTLLAACFVLALSTQASAPETSATVSSRAAKIRELHRQVDEALARLVILEPLAHNFVPRGASATDYPPRPKRRSGAQSTATVCLFEGRVVKQRIL